MNWLEALVSIVGILSAADLAKTAINARSDRLRQNNKKES